MKIQSLLSKINLVNSKRQEYIKILANYSFQDILFIILTQSDIISDYIEEIRISISNIKNSIFVLQKQIDEIKKNQKPHNDLNIRNEIKIQELEESLIFIKDDIEKIPRDIESHYHRLDK